MSRDYEVVATNHLGWGIQLKINGHEWIAFAPDGTTKAPFKTKAEAEELLAEMLSSEVSKYRTGVELRIYPVLDTKKKTK